ncbi:MAG TPA: acyl-CoA dehydrogenase family protein [Deltaproteobacteria bacterium]|jgi:acyl-CoA dehydrogenase|nr:acyl-CoA dehydrogenase family protein [Deltaproteobacteria bacterium]
MLSGDLVALKESVCAFAGKAIAPRTDLSDYTILPPEVHEAFVSEGLYGLGIPVAYEGRGGGWLHIAVTAQAIVENGFNLGCGLSWLMHAVISRYLFFGFGTDAQKLAFLPDLASGRKIPCLAISEPGVGAHPKHLKTRASALDGSFSISGEKAYLTNGPIADLYVVLAITREEEGRKSFTAFIVPSSTPGLTRTPLLDLGFLRPCPHGGIVLDGCVVPGESILGRKHHAYTDISLPFRQLEDTMMMGLFVGGSKAQVRLIADAFREQGREPSKDAAFLMGEAVSTADSLEILAHEAANTLDASDTGNPGLLPVTLFARRAAKDIQDALIDIVQKTGLEMGKAYNILTNDLVSSMKIAGNVANIKQERLGRSLFSG